MSQSVYSLCGGHFALPSLLSEHEEDTHKGIKKCLPSSKISAVSSFKFEKHIIWCQKLPGKICHVINASLLVLLGSELINHPKLTRDI